MKKRILIALFYFFIAYLAIEIFCRIDGRYISYGERSENGGSYNSPFEPTTNGWDNTPAPGEPIDYTKTEFNTHWIPNNEGLKDKTLTLQKKGPRIMVFGDSFTEGIGAPNDSAYPRILEKLIQTNIDSTAEVINCGLSASDVYTEYELLQGKMLKYHPDYILLTFNSTDIYEYTTRGGFERFLPDNQVQYRSAPWFEIFYAHSFLVRRIVHDVFHYDYRFQKTADYKQINDSACSKIAEALDSFNNTCILNHIAFGVVFHPMGIEYKTASADYQNMPLIMHCQKRDICYVDEAEFFKLNGVDTNNITNFYWPKDGHFNHKGYALLAKCAYTIFEKQNCFLPKNSPIHSLPK